MFCFGTGATARRRAAALTRLTMISSFSVLAALLGAIAIAPTATAQSGKPYQSEQPKAGVVFTSVKNLKASTAGMSVSPPPGLPVQEESIDDWPATFLATFFSDKKRWELCTATAIGTRTLLTAGHCVPKDGKVVFERKPGESYPASCLVAGEPVPGQSTLQYNAGWVYTCNSETKSCGGRSTDIALCYVDTKINSIADKLERIAPASTPLRRSDRLFVLGYGCTDRTITSGWKWDGDLQKRMLTSGWFGVETIPDATHNYFFSLWGSEAKGDSTICPGDSGGPVFQVPGNDKSNLGSRSIVAISSAVFGAVGNPDLFVGPSLFTSIYTRPENELLNAFSKRHQNTDICGITPVQNERCRR